MFGLFRRADSAPPPVQLNLKDPAFFADPYPTYAALQGDDPVHWAPEGFWFLSAYDDVRAALSDARLSNHPAAFAVLHARNRDQRIAADIANRLIAFMDAPEHTALRGPIAKGFRQALSDLQPDFAHLTRQRIQQYTPNQDIDFVSDFAEPLAADMACAMFGLPSADAAEITEWSYDFFTLFHAVPDPATLNALEPRLRAFRDYMTAHLTQASAGSVTATLAQEVGHRLSEAEVVDNLMLLIADTIGNVQAALATCIHLLLCHPQNPAAFASPDLMNRIIAECLRLESPGQFQGRITLEPVEIGGKSIPAKSIVLLGFGAANRDTAHFAQPHVFDPNRPATPHMAFGAGRHMCLGHAVVRQQLAAVLPILFGAGELTLKSRGPVVWQPRYGHRWLQNLPVTIVAQDRRA